MEYYISTNLKFLRNKNKISQKKIAELCKKQNTAVANWEKGIRTIKIRNDELKRIGLYNEIYN